MDEVVPGVYFTNSPTFKMNWSDVQFLKDRADVQPDDGEHLKKARLCTHPSADYLGFHEMLIAMQKGLYIRPHRHHGKGESFNVIEGDAMFVVFNDRGDIEDQWRLSRRGVFYHRVPELNWHTIIPLTDFFVVHEVTEGPFLPKSMEWAMWAPEADGDEAGAYVGGLLDECDVRCKAALL